MQRRSAANKMQRRSAANKMQRRSAANSAWWGSILTSRQRFSAVTFSLLYGHACETPFHWR